MLDVKQEDFLHTIESAKARLLRRRRPDGKWDFHAHLGAHFTSQYALCLDWLGRSSSKLDRNRLRKILRASQLPDGSWHQVKDASIQGGELNTTIFNYWFLKSTAHPEDKDLRERARHFILAKGGLDSSSLFTKTFLALFAQCPWHELVPIPYLVFFETLPSNYRNFAQWVIPHLMPIAYLRFHRVAKDLGPKHSLAELWLKKPSEAIGLGRLVLEALNSWNRFSDQWFLRKVLKLQRPRGSWGGYTSATQFTLLALDHAIQQHPSLAKEITPASERGLQFIENLFFNAEEFSYLGCTMDGHYWDTFLVANSLLEAGAKTQDLLPTALAVAPLQDAAGGFPYGYDFEYASDVDDTAEAMLFLQNFPQERERVKRGAQWLIDSQNKDGGWGAFDRENVGNPLLRALTSSYRDSVDLFDDSSADSTGHVLDALSLQHHHLANSPTVRKAVDYLWKTQETNGSWIGRWAVNYLFGTTCAVVGLLKAGVPATDPRLQKALGFLRSHQNPDGGFGESTLTYLDPHNGKGAPSTASQTAWVLWCFSHAGLAEDPASTAAALYLAKNFSQETGWHDESVTGTGHPGVVYMNYPSYAEAFPLMALGTYARRLGWITKK